MIVTLSGLTGTGKSFFKKKIFQNMKFNNLVIVTTREKRKDEINGIDKYFVSKEEFFEMKRKKEIISDFKFLGEYYGYRTIDLKSNENQVTELHYEYIELFKKNAKNVFSIYILPNEFKRPIQELQIRKLPKNVEEKRIEEMKEQQKIFETNKNIQKQFDYILKNDYTEESIQELFRQIERRKEFEKKSNCWKLENEYASK